MRKCLLVGSVGLAGLLVLSASAGSWEKFGGNPVLGNEKLGTCFDVNVVTDGPAPYTMYFSWRPKKAIALVRSTDGFAWTQELEICLEADPTSGWENDLNRSCTVKRDGVWHMWYTGQVPGKPREGWSRIGYATSTDGVRFTRGGKTFRFRDVEVRTSVSDHNDYLIGFTMPFEITVGGFTLFHSGDTSRVEQLNPTRRPDLWVVHPRIGLSVADGVKRFAPKTTVIAHLNEFTHPKDKYRWTWKDGQEERAKVEGADGKAVVPVWGERIV